MRSFVTRPSRSQRDGEELGPRHERYSAIMEFSRIEFYRQLLLLAQALIRAGTPACSRERDFGKSDAVTSFFLRGEETARRALALGFPTIVTQRTRPKVGGLIAGQAMG